MKRPVKMDKHPVVVIPAYKPAPVLLEIVEVLAGSGCVRKVVVVDDGSGEQYAALFKSLVRLDNVYLYSRAVNGGKGAALKDGFRMVLNRFPDSSGIIATDADGQHLPGDILKLARAFHEDNTRLILGARSLSDRNVPARNRAGNMIARWALFFLTGRILRDTQTGLRGIPMGLASCLLNFSSNRYEFEMEMLLYSLKAKIPIAELEIETVYRGGGSHFRPFADTFRVFSILCGWLLRTPGAPSGSRSTGMKVR